MVGGTRGLIDRDVTTIGGVQVTTKLRTALDLGRLLWRFDALAALDGFARLGVPTQSLYDGLEFHGSRQAVSHDLRRRAWLSRERGWRLEVFRNANVYGLSADAGVLLGAAYRRARGTSWN